MEAENRSLANAQRRKGALLMERLKRVRARAPLTPVLDAEQPGGLSP